MWLVGREVIAAGLDCLEDGHGNVVVLSSSDGCIARKDREIDGTIASSIGVLRWEVGSHCDGDVMPGTEMINCDGEEEMRREDKT